MNPPSPTSWKSGKVVVGIVAMFGVIVVVATAWRLWGVRHADQPFVYYTVKRANLPIVVTERGNLESQMETTIRCQVESRGYNRSGSSGTQIIFIVPNGSAVKEGDLLVELDSAPIREELDNQVLANDRAEAERIQAQAKYDNQITQNITSLAEAKLQLELAKLELLMYEDKESGTLKLDREAIERLIEEANNSILESQAALEMQRYKKHGVESLFKLGYKGKSELDESRLSFLQAERKLGSATNQLKTHMAAMRKLSSYESKMQTLTLEGAVETAERNVDQVETDNVSLEAQAKAAYDAAVKVAKKEKEKLDKLNEQLELCKITAPHEGMVVYARESRRSSSSEIEEGAFVRERQSILALPNLAKMQVKTYIHESVLDQVTVGQRASVRVDAFPDKFYHGLVESVGVVPASRNWSSSDVKTYETVVRIEGTVNGLKPGMNAVVEIDIDCLDDILSVPVQAVVQEGRENWCYIDAGDGVEQRSIELGRTNDKFIQVQDGVQAGERVVLNPMIILDQQTNDQEIGPEEDLSPDTAADDAPSESAPKPIPKRTPESKKQKKMAAISSLP